MKGLTERQAQVLSFLYDFKETNGYAPSYREIAARFGFSSKAAYDHIKALQKKGAVAGMDNVSRSNTVIAVDDVMTETAR